MNDNQVIDYIQQGVEKGLIKQSDNNNNNKRIEYLEQKKSRLFTNPEEQVQAEAYCRLILQYGYPKNRVQNFVLVTMGSGKKEADIRIASTGFAVIRELKTSAITKEFLFHAFRLSSSLRQMGQRSTGGNYPAITQEELGNILIPYVDLSHQKEIVSHIQNIKHQAKQLQTEAQQILADAKAEVKRMILGDSGGEPCQPAG